MMRGLVDIHGADHVYRAGQLLFLQPGQISQVDETKTTVAQYNSNTGTILGVHVDGLLLRVLAQGFIRPAAFERFGDEFSRGGNDGDVHALERNLVSGFENGP